jgi:hypothetical protein
MASMFIYFQHMLKGKSNIYKDFISWYNFHKDIIYQYTFRTHFINSMEQTHSTEAESSTASKETQCPPILFLVTLSYYLCLGLPSGLFPSITLTVPRFVCLFLSYSLILGYPYSVTLTQVLVFTTLDDHANINECCIKIWWKRPT